MSKACRNSSNPGISYKKIGLFEPDFQQELVIEGVGGSLVVNAGAGTGKTATLTNAYVDALLTREVDGQALTPRNILAITYTNAAAVELKERISSLLRKMDRPDLVVGMGESWISTFNSFCAQVLSAHGMRVAELFNVDPAFRTIDQATTNGYRELAFQRAMRSMEHKDPAAFKIIAKNINLELLKTSLVEALHIMQVHRVSKSHISIGSDDFEPQEDWQHRAYNFFLAFKELTAEFEYAFTAIKQEHNVIDFSDQIQYVQRLFQKAPDILKSYQDQFAIIFIDEFQDTNFVQLDIFESLSTENLTVVGDGRQSIYAFQGADSSVFSNALSGTKLVESKDELNKSIQAGGSNKYEMRLSRNYRSRPEIINAVNDIFSRQELFGRDFVQLTPSLESKLDGLPEKKRVSIKPVAGAGNSKETAAKQAEWIAREFREFHDNGYLASDMVVLIRSRSKAHIFRDALKKEGLASVLVGGEKLYEDPIVMQAISMLSLVDNPHDNRKFIEAALSVMGDVSDDELARLEAAKREIHQIDGTKRKSYYTIATEHLTKTDDQSLIQFVNLIKTAGSMRGRETPANIFRYLISSTGIDELLFAADLSSELAYSYEQSYVNLATVLDEIEQMQIQGEGFRDVVISLNLLVEAGKGAEDLRPPLPKKGVGAPDAVRVMTVHGSKGLEFPIVAVPILTTSGKSGTARTFFRRDEESGESRLLVGVKERLTYSEKKIVEEISKSKVATYDQMGIGGDTLSRDYVYLDTSVSALANAAALEEEKRLLYVALTRAEERLLITYPVSKGSLKMKDDSPGLLKAAGLAKFLHKAIVKPAYSILNAKRLDEGFGTNVDCDFDPSEIIGIFNADPKPDNSECVEEGRDVSIVAPEAQEARAVISDEPSYIYREPDMGEPSSRQKLIQITATEIDQYKTCPRQYRFRSVLRLGEITRKKDKPGSTEFGTAMHALLEEGIARARSGKDPMTGEAIARTAGQHRLDEELTGRLVEAASKVVKTSYWDRATKAKEAYAEAQFFEQLIDLEGDEYFINGFIDLLVFEDDGSALVIDYKSGEWEGARESNYETQASVYALAAMRKGAPKVEVVFLRPEVEDAITGVQEFVFKFHQDGEGSTAKFFSEKGWEISQVLAEEKAKMESAGLLNEDDIKAHVEGKDACAYCSFKGELCPGYEKKAK